MYHNAIYTFPFLRDFPNLRTHDITAPDWKIYEPVKEINPDAFRTVGIEIERNTKELAKQIKEKLFEAYKIEPHKEKSTMLPDLRIIFKSGKVVIYGDGTWDDYSCDEELIAVKKNGALVDIYNFDNVFCVELKSREG